MTVRAFAAVVAMLLVTGCGRVAGRTVQSVPSPAGGAVAFVREEPSLDPPNQTLWVSLAGGAPQPVTHLGEDTHWCERIVWSDGGRAVLFVTADGQGLSHGVVAWRPDADARVFKSASVSLAHVRSARALILTDDAHIVVAASDLAPGFPLWLPPDARGAVQLNIDGSADIRLEWPRGSARERVGAALIEHFRTAGWTERSFEVLNPTIATSFAAGWLVPHPGVHRWTGEWTRNSDEFVSYSLTDVDETLRGYAYYLTPSLARRQARIGQSGVPK